MPRRHREGYERIWIWGSMTISLALRAAEQVDEEITQKEFNRAVLQELQIVNKNLEPDADENGEIEGSDYFAAVLRHAESILERREPTQTSAAVITPDAPTYYG